MVINELYGLQDISDDEFHDRISVQPYVNDDTAIRFGNTVRASMMIPDELIMAAIKDIYNDVVHDGDLSPELFKGVSNVIQSACQKGVSQASFNPDDEFKRQLLHSADVFSAFKVHSAQQAMASKLLDDQGNLRSFSEFRDAVLPIASHQCGRWLRTEYDTAVIRAHQAADWQQFLDEADVFPNLEWMPSTSVKPGADHQVFWGTILPISDPFWTQHRPGDRWNCKCSLQATDKAPTGRPTSASPVNTDPQPGLDSNPGATSEVFSQSHPYFPSDCNSCPFRSATVPSASADGNFKNQAKDCMHCQAINACIDRTIESPSGYNQDAEFGDRFLISKCADEKDLDDNVKIARILLSQFHNLEVTIRAHIDPTLGKKNPEYTLNGMTGDRKAIKTEKGIADGFKKAIEQGCSVVVIDLNSGFIRGRVNLDEVARRIDNRHMDFESGIIKYCYVVYKEKAVVIQGLCGKEEIKATIKRLEP